MRVQPRLRSTSSEMAHAMSVSSGATLLPSCPCSLPLEMLLENWRLSVFCPFSDPLSNAWQYLRVP